MNNLDRIIGPAPSELSWEKLRIKVAVERERVRGAIEYWKAGGGQRGKAGKGKVEPGFSNRELKLMAKQLGVSLSELNTLMVKAAGEKRREDGGQNL